MDPGLLLDRVLDDEGLTADLDEPEAMPLIGALTDAVRNLAAGSDDVASARRQTDELCRQARRIAQVAVVLRDDGEAAARARAEEHGLRWPDGARNAGELVRRMVGALNRRTG